jgi:hypothetical protein
MPTQSLQHYHGALVTPSDTKTLQESLYASNRSSCLYIGVGGDVHVLTAGGDDVTFYSLPGGSFVPVHVAKVFATGTSALSIIALDMSLGSSDGCYSTDIFQQITTYWPSWGTHWNDCLT